MTARQGRIRVGEKENAVRQSGLRSKKGESDDCACFGGWRQYVRHKV